MITPTKDCTQQVLLSPSSIVSPKSINWAPTQAHYFWQVSSNLLGGQGVGQHHLTFGRPSLHHIRNTQHFVEQGHPYSSSKGNACSPIMSRPPSHQFHMTQPFPSSNANYIRNLVLPQDLCFYPTNHHLAGVLL